MSISGLRTWTTNEVISAAKLNADKSVIETKFNAGITTADLASAAGITNAQLAYSKYEFAVPMTVNSAQWAAAADNDVVAIAHLPADVTSVGYTILKVEYAYVNAGTASTAGCDFAIDFGYFNGAGAFTQVNRIVNPVSITASLNVNSYGTLATSAITTDTTNRPFFAIIATDVVEAAGTRPFGVADEFLTVTIKLQRTAGLRG